MNKEFSVADIDRYRVEEIQKIETPRPLFYKWALLKNRDKIKKISNSFRSLRLMTKSFKSTRILDLYTQDGLTAIKTSSVREARVLGRSKKINDILVSFPCFGPVVWDFLRLQEEFSNKRCSILVNSIESANQLSREANQPVFVYIDIDPGMKRTGIPFYKLAEIAQEVAKLPNIRIRGLHIYDGHVQHPNPHAVERISEFLMYKIDRAVNLLKDIIHIEEVVTSSSLTMETNLRAHKKGKKVWHMTVSPGTAVLWDTNYNDIMPGAFDYACTVATRVVDVISHRGTYILTTDCGIKFGVSSDCGPPHVMEHKGFQAFGASERHGCFLWLAYDRATRETLSININLMLGKVILVFPRHVCTTVNQYNFGYLINERKELERFEIDARDG